MQDEKGFLRSIAEDPDSNTLRLIYADWLEESGNDDRAEYLRLECELTTLGESHKRAKAIESRLGALRATIGGGWVAKVGKQYVLLIEDFKPLGKLGWLRSLISFIGFNFENSARRDSPFRLRNLSREVAERLRDQLQHFASVRIRAQCQDDD